MLLLDNLALFLRIVEKGGLAAAGRETGLSPASVSEKLAALEVHYGARLLTRTTRSISLTDEGAQLVTGAKRILAEADELESRIRLGVDKISGTIHISAALDIGRNRISPLLDSFIKEHPDISVDLTLSDGVVDMAAQGIDLAIRYGNLADSTLRARKVASNRRLICASPDYIAMHGAPLHPDDLQDHNCLMMRFGSQVARIWPFLIKGKQKNCTVKGNRVANDGELVRKWCCAGLGIARKAEWDVYDQLQSGELVTLLEEFEPKPSALSLVYPAGAAQPRRVKLLIEHLTRHLTGLRMKDTAVP